MAYFNQGIYRPKNPAKYVGTQPITYRSAWELTFMNLCDQHPNVLSWASESIKIPYQHPLTGKWHQYIPDFFIIYVDKNGKKHGDIIEIKPMSQTVEEAARSKRDKAAFVVNQAKWKAAMEWCRKQGLNFRVMTEQQLYRSASGK